MNLLLEVGCEEIPAKLVGRALQDLGAATAEAVREADLAGDGFGVRPYGTPRRLAVLAGPVRERQPDRSEQLLGPRWEAAFDGQGRPTPAAAGFARSKGISPEELVPLQSPRGKVAGLERKVPGRPAPEVLAECLPRVLQGLRFPKSMRWGEGEFSFVRPVHWLCALLDGEVIPLEFAGVRSTGASRGHRFVSPDAFTLARASDYLAELRRRSVMADPQERRRQVAEQTRQLAAQVGGRPLADPDLEEEVTFLLEQPVAVLGRFDRRFLDLPREVLVAAMRNHQRYFAVEDGKGRLLDAFVALANTPARDLEVVRRGFERVLVARLTDAEFFFANDRKKPLAERVPQLDGVIFQAELGSYGEKTRRLVELAGGLMDLLRVDDAGLRRRVLDACTLCKTDLLTEMVKEFPELQGTMGGVYAGLEGRDQKVAQALREHVLPRSAADEPPRGLEGAIVGLADRLDTLAGCFGVGLRPTGVSDPFALRRQSLAVMAILLEHGLRLPLGRALELAVSGVRDKVEAALLSKLREKERKRAARKSQAPAAPAALEPFQERLRDELLEFFAGRLRQRLIESEGARADVVEAVLASGADDVVAARARLRALRGFFERPEFADLAVAFKRVANILGDFAGGRMNTDLLRQAEEKELWRVAEQLRPEFEKAFAADDFSGALEMLATRLRAPVDSFFDQVLVNDPQHPDLQQNRLALLQGIESLFGKIADFSRLQLKVQ